MADRRIEMRTLPAILLVAFVALLILASAALTTQFGVHDWPAPPSPDTATRPVTPTEAAGKATEKAARTERAADSGSIAYSAPEERKTRSRPGQTSRRDPGTTGTR